MCEFHLFVVLYFVVVASLTDYFNGSFHLVYFSSCCLCIYYEMVGGLRDARGE